MLYYWNKEQISSFLNGRAFISLDDYAYAYFIYLTMGFNFRLDEEFAFDFIAPILSNAVRLIPNNSDIIADNIIYSNSSK